MTFLSMKYSGPRTLGSLEPAMNPPQWICTMTGRRSGFCQKQRTYLRIWLKTTADEVLIYSVSVLFVVMQYLTLKLLFEVRERMYEYYEY